MATVIPLKMPLSLYCFCKAQCSVGLSLYTPLLTIVQVMNVLREVTSLTANRFTIFCTMQNGSYCLKLFMDLLLGGLDILWLQFYCQS